jgi:hypothetical protein
MRERGLKLPLPSFFLGPGLGQPHKPFGYSAAKSFTGERALAATAPGSVSTKGEFFFN